MRNRRPADRRRVSTLGRSGVCAPGRNAGNRGPGREIVNELRNRARNVLLTEAIVTGRKVGKWGSEDLIGLRDDSGLAAKWPEHDVKTRDDLAELAVDELTEMTGIDDERAKELILEGTGSLVRVSGGGQAMSATTVSGTIELKCRSRPC